MTARAIQSEYVANLPFKLEIIPNVLVSTLAENPEEVDKDATASLYLMTFDYDGEECGASLAVNELDLEVREEVHYNTVATLKRWYAEYISKEKTE